MELTEDAFRALARSSPWRWRSLHFTRHAQEYAEAWVERPGRLRVRGRRGRVQKFHEKPGEGSAVVAIACTDDGTPATTPRTVYRSPQQVEPSLRPDGLVAERPDEFDELVDGELRLVEYGDSMYGDYRWVAMLDPVELSEATTVRRLEAGEHRGRPVWRAEMTALPGYGPTCGCCPLLWSEISDRDELDDYFEPGADYPDAYRLALDIETAVVVELVPIRGGHTGAAEIDLEIHDVDGRVVTS